MALFYQSRRSRSRRRWGRLCLTWLAPVCVFAALAAYVAQNRAVPLQRANPQTRAVLASATRRPVYPYSIIPGGAYTADELSAAAARDPLARAHYRGFDLPQARPEPLAQSRLAYVSYRRRDAIYWSRRPVLLHRGETVLSDGTNLIRARCGNRLSDTPQSPIAADEPSSEDWDVTTADPAGPGSEGGYWPPHSSKPATDPDPRFMPPGAAVLPPAPKPARPPSSLSTPRAPVAVLPPGSPYTPPNPTRTLPPGSPVLPPDPTPSLPPGSPTPLPTLTPTSPTPTSTLPPNPPAPVPQPTPTPTPVRTAPSPKPAPVSPSSPGSPPATPKPPSPLLPALPPLQSPASDPIPITHPRPDPFDDPPLLPGAPDRNPKPDEVPVPPVPEPSSILLFGSAALIALWRMKHRRRH